MRNLPGIFAPAAYLKTSREEVLVHSLAIVDGKINGMALLEVQQKTERLLYRAEKLESDATVETNVLAKAVQSHVEHTSATVQELQVYAERVGVNTQHIEDKTDAIYPLANDTHELVTEIAMDVKKLNVSQTAQQENAGIASSRLKDFIQDQIMNAKCK